MLLCGTVINKLIRLRLHRSSSNQSDAQEDGKHRSFMKPHHVYTTADTMFYKAGVGLIRVKLFESKCGKQDGTKTNALEKEFMKKNTEVPESSIKGEAKSHNTTLVLLTLTP